MTPSSLAGQFGDTTYTKVFVGGLAWETQKETMKKYFEQFGEILEAVVITDKATGRSKGYGFVTFREPDAAMRACVDAAPVIDGRRANCNVASLGAQRSKPSTPKHGAAGRNFRVMSSFQTGFGGGAGAAFPSAASTFPHYAIQQGLPYNVYGYSSYSPDYTYPTSYYNMYGGQLPSTLWTGGATSYTASGQSYGVQYPHHLFQYSAINSPTTGGYPQHYGAPMSLAPTAALPSGVTMALQAPPIPHR
ncbi:hypothetical protein OIU85_004014 [Salix viminalis]|uniref:RRM domain-containing protein n=1 Tax=Salix viminalis TaxID=40686 RepID=A0A9Q0PRQ6_SALVM|nr:hypothetical protein OIU85_004014 [Salix viminalis]